MFSGDLGLSKKIKSVCDELDVFKIPVNLLLNDKTKTSTSIGKVFSLIILIYVLISFVNSDLIQKSHPNILIQDIKLDERFPLRISKNDLSLVVGVSNSAKEYEYDEKIFKISAFIYFYDNKNKTKITQKIEMHVCEENDFEDKTLFKRLNLNGFL